jgi:hypothetical protein
MARFLNGSARLISAGTPLVAKHNAFSTPFPFTFFMNKNLRFLLASLSLTLLTSYATQAQVANDECIGAIPLTIGAMCSPTTGNVTGATQSLPATNRCGSGGTNTVADIWYSFVAVSSGQEITLSSNLTNFVMEVRSGSCASSSSLVCGTTLQLLQATGLTVGQTYYIRVYAPDFFPPPTGAGAIFTLCLTGAPANDEPCGAVALPLTATGTPPQPVSGTTFGATTSSQPIVLPTNCTGTSGVRDVWYSFTPAVGMTSVRLAFSGAGASVVRLFTTTDCAAGPLTQVGCRVNTSGSVLLPGLTPGQLYYLAVSDDGTNSTPPGPFTITGTTITAAHSQVVPDACVLFPNPSNTGTISLHLPSPAAGGEAVLLNALGQVVRRSPLLVGNTEQKLVTRELAAGIYTLRVAIGNTVLTRKLVLE